MRLEVVKDKIERYLRKDDSHPRLVNVNNPEDAMSICEYFSIGENMIKSVADFPPGDKDENLSEDAFWNFLDKVKGAVFLTGFTSYYKFFGGDKLQDFINGIIGMSLFESHLVLICYQCEDYLAKIDPRFRQLIYIVEGQKAELPRLTFVAPNIPGTPGEKVIEGIRNAAKHIESKPSAKLFIHTAQRKSSYPLTLFTIKELNNSYEALCSIDELTKHVEKGCGTKKDWELALTGVSRHGTWSKYITSVFGSAEIWERSISDWQDFDPIKKWLYFIALKLFGVKKSWCLREASNSAKDCAGFVRGIFRSLLSVPHDDKDFWEHYEERKKLLRILGNPDDEVTDYCKMVKSKEKHVLYYLTDATQSERNLIFECLAKYSEEAGRDRTEEVLQHVYPDLHSYLQPYRFKIPLLDDYFQQYKYQKVINKIFPEFLQVVNEQAEKREFNLFLPARSSKLDAIEKKGTVVYFVDAMGVEYLSYISDLCRKQKMMANVTVCHCELPSVTSLNKEFVAVFANGGADFVPDKNGIKSLDDLKHHGKEEFDFTLNTLPTYISRELEIIKETIGKIATKLSRGDYERAVMISDHGASRLAVLNNVENKWGSVSNAEHSGRCCPVTEVDEQPPCAVEENNHWVLANYDRFKGGRKANIEVHGGATLEEVVVPIIEIVYSSEPIEIHLLSQTIKFSRRKKNAVIKVFSKTRLNNLSVEVSGLSGEYEGHSADGQTFNIELPELVKAGTYTVKVYSKNNLLESGLQFTAENTDFSEKQLL